MLTLYTHEKEAHDIGCLQGIKMCFTTFSDVLLENNACINSFC